MCFSFAQLVGVWLSSANPGKYLDSRSSHVELAGWRWQVRLTYRTGQFDSGQANLSVLGQWFVLCRNGGAEELATWIRAYYAPRSIRR